ncbi:PAS domain-containing protein [Candidatus Saccharibacteria bacterium]|nr:PAS domain-containing protein [Candidatus Saccharibacteria bacterium]
MVKKQKQSSARLSPQLEHERLESLIGSMADGVLAVDDNIKVATYNGAALNILDVNGNITGRSLKRLLNLFDHNGQPVNAEQLVSETKLATTNRDLLLHYADGSKINLYLSIAPVHLGYGSQGEKGYVLLLRDITHEKSLEEERDEFISVVSHELRTPIAIAEGNISNVQFIVEKSGHKDQMVTDALKLAHEQIQFLAGMVNDLSTLSRAERGKLTLEVSPINAHVLVSDLTESYRAEAEAKGLKIRADLDPHLEAFSSSELYVREVLQNFVTNSIKYTEKGSITIGAKPQNGGVLFTVSDTGIGISKADQERVFDKFFRSEDFRTRSTSGTGLGLYVTMKLSRLIHADINLESELDKGSVFSIFIPDLKETDTN